jgi:hypothetical protein
MFGFIDDHRGIRGVKPIRKVLPIDPSPYRAKAARRRGPTKPPARARREAALMPEIARVFEESFRVCGVRMVWLQLKREGRDLAGCKLARQSLRPYALPLNHPRRHRYLLARSMSAVPKWPSRYAQRAP